MLRNKKTPSEQGRGKASPRSPIRRMARMVFWTLFVFFVIGAVGWAYEYNRTFKDFFNPLERFAAARSAGKATAGEARTRRGVVFTTTLIRLQDQLREAWLPNDKVWPSIVLDNPQNFQLGQLEALRYSVRVLRDKLSRQRTTDKIDPHVDKAFTDLSNNPHYWLFPSFESKLAGAGQSLAAYREGLKKGTSSFYPRADNLIELLDQITSLLGGVDTRLANAPRDWSTRLSEETAGDSYSEGEVPTRILVPWTKIDDNFYFARGVAYVLRHLLIAVKWEFRDIMNIKKSHELMQNIIAELSLADFEPWVVLNGSRDSIFANHSLSLMATLENVRQKLVNLQQLLEH